MTATHLNRPVDGTPRPTTQRSAKVNRAVVSTIAQRMGLLVIVMVLWEALARTLDSRAVPQVLPVIEAAVVTVPTAAFWSALLNTLHSWSFGMLIAMSIGIPVGLLIGSSTLAMRATRAVVEFLRTVPAIMLVPLAVLLWGATIEMKVALITVSAVWPLLIHAAYGIRSVDTVAKDSVTVFGVGRVQRIAFLYIPSALPIVATGVRIAATIALLISIGAEIVTSAPGIGYEIALGQANNAADRSFVYVLLCGLLGVTINLTFSAIEGRTMAWHASQRTKRSA